VTNQEAPTVCPTCGLDEGDGHYEVVHNLGDDDRVHVCNYASPYRPTLCSRLVKDGHRLCYQHRPKGATS